MYEPKQFNIPTLDGISEESVKQHIGLYEGYVKNFNAMSALIGELAKDTEKNIHALSEIVRRRSFEFDGMRLHEHYFEQFEGGAQAADDGSALRSVLKKEHSSIETFEAAMKGIGSMRGPGWAILYYDKVGDQILSGFVGEQHQGHFATLPIILALDVWEHAYLLDHGAAGKGKYLDAFFKNLNWRVPEERFARLQAAGVAAA